MTPSVASHDAHDEERKRVEGFISQCFSSSSITDDLFVREQNYQSPTMGFDFIGLEIANNLEIAFVTAIEEQLLDYSPQSKVLLYSPQLWPLPEAEEEIITVLAEIEAVYSEAREPNWDGAGASPVLAETYHLACDLARRLADVLAPEISVDPDGNVLFEWTGDGRQMLTVSISPDRRLSYAAMRGYDRRSGTESFSGAAIQVLVDCLRWVGILDDA